MEAEESVKYLRVASAAAILEAELSRAEVKIALARNELRYALQDLRATGTTSRPLSPESAAIVDGIIKRGTAPGGSPDASVAGKADA